MENLIQRYIRDGESNCGESGELVPLGEETSVLSERSGRFAAMSPPSFSPKAGGTMA